MDLNKEIWEGWTVQNFIDSLDIEISMIMNNESHVEPLKNKKELKAFCMENQPYYKKFIPEVVDYFAKKYKL